MQMGAAPTGAGAINANWGLCNPLNFLRPILAVANWALWILFLAGACQVRSFLGSSRENACPPFSLHEQIIASNGDQVCICLNGGVVAINVALRPLMVTRQRIFSTRYVHLACS